MEFFYRLLDFVLHDFSSTYYANAKLPAPPFAEAIQVKLGAPTTITTVEQPRAIRMADFDADGRVDVDSGDAGRVGGPSVPSLTGFGCSHWCGAAAEPHPAAFSMLRAITICWIWLGLASTTRWPSYQIRWPWPSPR